MNITKKRVIIGATVAAIALSGTGVAYGYWTTTGSGTGSATAGTSTAWTVGEDLTYTHTGGPLYPDASIGTGHKETLKYKVTNGGSGIQNLAHVVIKVDPNWAAVGCSASDFSVGGAGVGADYTDASLGGSFTANQSKTALVTVQMIDNGLDQEGCKGITVPLVFEAS